MFGKGRKQRDAYREWALAHGWTYAEQDDSLAQPALWGFSRAYSRRPQAVDVLTGNHRGRPAVCFTYRYVETSLGDDGMERSRAGIAIHSLRLPRPLPAVEVKQRWFVDGQLTTIPDDADFGRRYEVVADDPSNLAAIFTPELCTWMAQLRAVGFHLAQDRLFLRGGERVDLNRLDQWVSYLSDVADRLPV